MTQWPGLNPRRVRAALACCALCVPALAPAGADVLRADGFEQCQPPSPLGSTAEWGSVFMPWPAYGLNARLALPFDGHIALRFTAATASGSFGTFLLADYPGSGGGQGLMSISRTPGCFDPAFLGPNCLSPVSSEPGVAWTIAASGLRCALEPGASYYLNMTLGTSGGQGRDLRSLQQ